MAAATNEIIGTHSGSFHCDEALACFMLKSLPRFQDAKIVRTRDPAVLSTIPIVVDVGGVYDPAAGRYDHHQRGFMDTFSPKYATKLSSAGLVYKHFGLEVVGTMVPSASPTDREFIFQRVYKTFIEAIDGIDNGVSQFPADLVPAYENHTDLSSRVGQLNPDWNDSESNPDELFERAVALTGADFTQAVQKVVKSYLPARNLVVRAVEERNSVHPSGEIIILSRYTEWKNHLFEIEQELNLASAAVSVKFVLYADTAGQWRIQAVAVRPDSFISRLGLPEAWRGLRDDVLSSKSGIPGCMFVHANGFIGGHKTLEGALQMATQTLQGAAQLKVGEAAAAALASMSAGDVEELAAKRVRQERADMTQG